MGSPLDATTALLFGLLKPSSTGLLSSAALAVAYWSARLLVPTRRRHVSMTEAAPRAGSAQPGAW